MIVLLPALLPVAIISSVLWAALRQPTQPPSRRTNFIARLPESAKLDLSMPQSKNSLFEQFSDWDQQYQTFIQTQIDPKIIGETRYQQMLELSGGELPKLSPQELQINRRLLLASSSLGLLTLGTLSNFTVTPAVLAIGAFNFIPLLKESWRIATEERRFSLLHLLVSYFGYMWFSGHYLIGTLGALLFNLNRKVFLLSQTSSHSERCNELPPRVFILLQGVEIEIPLQQLQVGDILILQAGQAVPIDGTILHGSVTVDQHYLTGESQPVEKIVGDVLFAGTVICSGRTQVRVEKTGTETTATKIRSMLNPPIEISQPSIADQFRFLESTKWFMLAGGAIGWCLAGPTTAVALLGCNFLTTMVPFKLIPLLGGLKSSAEHGVLIKDGRVLEKLPHITAVVFDKTGGLTAAQPQVTAIYCEPGYDEKQILTLAAAAEQRQNHSIAQAILTAAKEHHLQLPSLEAAEYQTYLGLKVQIDGQYICIGSEQFFNGENIVLPSSLQHQQNIAQEQGDTLLFVAVQAQTIGAIKLITPLRPDAQETIQWLKQQGIAVYIFSSDPEKPTRQLAEQLEVTSYFSSLLPEQKAQRIRELQAQGQQICFIGDGIHEATVLNQAEISISLRSAPPMATEAAHVVLMNDHLASVTLLWQVAQNYQNNIARNTVRAQQFSFAAAIGVVLFPYKMLIAKGMWGGQIVSGIHIANQPVLETTLKDSSQI